MLLTLIFSLFLPLGWPGGGNTPHKKNTTWLLSEPFMEDLANLLTTLTDFKEEILFARSCKPETQSRRIAKHPSQPHTLLRCVSILGPNIRRRYCMGGVQPASSLGETFGALFVTEREARNYFSTEMGGGGGREGSSGTHINHQQAGPGREVQRRLLRLYQHPHPLGRKSEARHLQNEQQQPWGHLSSRSHVSVLDFREHKKHFLSLAQQLITSLRHPSHSSSHNS